MFVRGDPKTPRYVVINGDESEPGTYVNRYSLELDPHLMLEGMLIAAYACNATLGYVYIRGEYGLAHERTQAAIREAYEAGYLGSEILGKAGFDFEVTFRRGAGAYIVGEETALFNSLEGKRGNPRYKPPFPTNVGVWGLPTAINNVETLSAAPAIVQNGPSGSRTWATATRPAPRCTACPAGWPSRACMSCRWAPPRAS